MRFLIDTQLPAALGDCFVQHGCTAVHVLHLGLAQSEDEDIWHHATTAGCVIISKDVDFVRMRAASAGGPAVVWLRYGNLRRKPLLERFAADFPSILAALNAGELLVEVH